MYEPHHSLKSMKKAWKHEKLNVFTHTPQAKMCVCVCVYQKEEELEKKK